MIARAPFLVFGEKCCLVLCDLLDCSSDRPVCAHRLVMSAGTVIAQQKSVWQCDLIGISVDCCCLVIVSIDQR